MQVLETLAPGEPLSADVLVVGAGGAGLAAALWAALEGASVVLVERTAHVGGTTALSAGTAWVPGTHHAASVNPGDSRAAVDTYLNEAVGEHAPEALRCAFLDNGPRVIARLEAETPVRLRPYARHPDYLSELPGSTLAGRALEPLPFDGRLLGQHFRLLRAPIPEFTVLGGMMVDRNDIQHLLNLTRSWVSLRHGLKLVAAHLRDRLSHPRGTRLVMGNALVARLLHGLLQQPRVTLLLNTELKSLANDACVLRQGGVRRTVQVGGGVVLASGGFNRHPALRARLLPGADPAWCSGAPGHTGQALSLALERGAQLGVAGPSHAYWAPVSLRQRADGSTAVFPHFVMDRAKPGFITVNQAGRRFVNESTSYHRFGLAMRAAEPPAVPAYLVCDARALRTYGMGMVRPGGRGWAAFLADGYLTEGSTLHELAQRLGVDPAGLADSVARNNRHAQTGVDPDFQRGTTAYQQNLGDAGAGTANPNLGPIGEAPFYAVRLYPGDIGAATGLTTDAQARVLDAEGEPIGGLYAVGNDMRSLMGGVYTAPGITLGPALVFAALAATDAACRARQTSE